MKKIKNENGIRKEKKEKEKNRGKNLKITNKKEERKRNKKALPWTVSHKDRLGQLYSGLRQFDARSVKLHWHQLAD